MSDLSLDLLDRKKEVIQRRLQRLQKYRSLTLEEYLSNEDIRDIIERNLEILIQAAVDLNKYLLKQVVDLRPEQMKAIQNSESFILLAHHNILPETLAQELANSGKFRNVLAHLYDEIVPDLVIHALNKALDLYPDYLYEIQIHLDSLEHQL